MDEKKSNATRLLCASAHLDSGFCNKVIEQVTGNKYQVKAPAYGLNYVAIANECLIAQGRRVIFQLLLSLNLVVAVSLYSQTPRYRPEEFIPTLVIVSLIAWILVFIQKCKEKSEARRFHKNKFKDESFRYSPSDSCKLDIERLINQQKGNVFIYSGFNPFVGSGFDIGGWSFTINILKGKDQVGHETLNPEPFEIPDLYEFIEKHVKKLELKNVTYENNLFINGTELSDEKWILPTKLTSPNPNAEQTVMESYKSLNSEKIRFYNCIQIKSWESDLILSMFLRFSIVGKNLFVEISNFLLTPLDEKFQKIDKIPSSFTFDEFKGNLFGSLLAFPFRSIFAPFDILNGVFETIFGSALDRLNKKTIKKVHQFDYGAKTSLREETSGQNYSHYFQKLDREMYKKIIEKHILEGIIEFLESKNIDTGELKENQTTIINSGIMVSGGTVKTENLAVGTGAKILNRLTKKPNNKPPQPKL